MKRTRYEAKVSTKGKAWEIMWENGGKVKSAMATIQAGAGSKGRVVCWLSC